MPDIEEVFIEGLSRRENARLRLWYIQPALELEGPPWHPQILTGPASGFELVRLVLAAEAQRPHTDGPVLVLVPEYTLRFAEVATVCDLLRQHSPNLLVVAGLEQLSEGQALALENRPDLWDTPANGRYTNCAAVIQGHTANLYLQPKIVPSQWEIPQFWPGRIIRHFGGENLFFIVQICSDLLQQPASNAGAVVSWLQSKGRRLDVVAWLQYNEKPRSLHFGQSLGSYCSRRATVLAAGSRKARPQRNDNYSVSGAVVHHNALPRYFALLDKEFHCFEPVATGLPISRSVLLRYDADVYCVTTVLGDSLFEAAQIEKGTFFQLSQPYVASTTLDVSGEHFHLDDLCLEPARLAIHGSPSAWTAHINAIVSGHLVPLHMRDFMAFLDLALLPHPQAGTTSHASGILHEPADLLCACWQHRVCIDTLTDNSNPSTLAFANVLAALAALRVAGLDFIFRYLNNHRTYLEVTLAGAVRYLAVVDPFGLDAGAAEGRLMPDRAAAALDTAYIVLGTKGRARRLVGSISPAVVPSVGATNLGRATVPGLRALYFEEFAAAIDAGSLRNAVEALFAA